MPTSTPSRSALGRRGEALAIAALEQRGYRILGTNLRTTRGEIDIAALHGRALCMIEVRMRTQDRFGSAEESIDARKQRRVVTAARELLASRSWPPHASVRFDVVAIDARSDPPLLRVLADAFSADSR